MCRHIENNFVGFQIDGGGKEGEKKGWDNSDFFFFRWTVIKMRRHVCLRSWRQDMCQLMWGYITKLSGLQPLKGEECDAFNPPGRKRRLGEKLTDWKKSRRLTRTQEQHLRPKETGTRGWFVMKQRENIRGEICTRGQKKLKYWEKVPLVWDILEVIAFNSRWWKLT